MGSLASTGCQVPGFRCTFAHAHGLWEGKETAKTWKREGSGWGEKGSRRADTPKEQSQLHLVSLRGTETQGRIPALGPGGPTGYICSRLGGHRGQCRFFSGGDPLTITTTMMAQIAPSMIIILQFFHQYFLFSLAALLSNCEAPACKASARSSSSDSFWSLSRTLSTFTRMMSTTSSTCAWVCWSRLLLVILGGGPGGPPPGAAPSVPSAGG